MTEVRITQAGSYADIEARAVAVTQAGAYAETKATALTITQAGVYAEFVPFLLTITQAGVYAELIEGAVIGPGTRVIYDDIDITEHVHSFQLEAAINQFETISLATADHTRRYGSGLAKWRLALQGWYDAAWDAAMMPDVVDNGAPKSASVLVQGPHPAHATGTRVRYDWPAPRARIAAANIKGVPRAALAWDAELVLSGAPDRTVD